MRVNNKRWLYYTLSAIAISGSVVSLFALFELGSPRWTIPVNMLSVICVLLAMVVRGRSANGSDGWVAGEVIGIVRRLWQWPSCPVTRP
jgi:uncharacterized membrane protein